MIAENPVDQDAVLDAFAAELTLAAYRVALQALTRGAWVDLELGLWKALAQEVRARGQYIQLVDGQPRISAVVLGGDDRRAK